MTEVRTTNSPEETEELGAWLSKRLSPGDRVGLVGDLGSGKTCFVRGIARGLGVKGYVKSPSFTIINIYDGGRLPLYHIDLYRVKDAREFYSAGLEEYIYGKGISIIEWADNIPEVPGTCTFLVRFSYAGETKRVLDIEEKRQR